MSNSKNLILKTDAEVFEYQKLEQEIFRVDLFNPYHTVFPKNPFRKKFSSYYVLEIKDWFSEPHDYEKLIDFLTKLKTKSFYASAPPFYMVNAIKVPIDATFEEYQNHHSYFHENSNLKGVGIRKSPETFYYDNNCNWAMVCDIMNNFTVVGLEKGLALHFENSFQNFHKATLKGEHLTVQENQ